MISFPYLGKCITDKTEIDSILNNDTYKAALYGCVYEKEFLKNPEDQCSAVNHTEKVKGIYTSETSCEEYDGDVNKLPKDLFDIPFGIRKTGNLKIDQYKCLHPKIFLLMETC